MNTKLLAVAGMAALMLALGAAGLVAAQNFTPAQIGAGEWAATPTATQAPNHDWPEGFGLGMMGGQQGHRGGGAMHGRGMGRMMGPAHGPMHDALLNALAEGLTITRAELDQQIATGKSPYQIATDLGFTAEQFKQIATAVRATAINQAVQEGTLTQEQADWMLQHMAAGKMGRPGGLDHHGGMRGDADNCPFAPTATPNP